MKDAIALYEQTLADRERVHGPDHRDTLTARGNLASVYHAAGRLVERGAAVRADRWPAVSGSLGRTIRTPSPRGPTWPWPITRRTGRRGGDAAAADPGDCEQVLPPDHPLTQSVRENLRGRAPGLTAARYPRAHAPTDRHVLVVAALGGRQSVVHPTARPLAAVVSRCLRPQSDCLVAADRPPAGAHHPSPRRSPCPPPHHIDPVTASAAAAAADSLLASQQRSAELELAIAREPAAFRVLTGDRPTGAAAPRPLLRHAAQPGPAAGRRRRAVRADRRLPGHHRPDAPRPAARRRARPGRRLPGRRHRPRPGDDLRAQPGRGAEPAPAAVPQPGQRRRGGPEPDGQGRDGGGRPGAASPR